MQRIKDIIAERNGEIIEYARRTIGNTFNVNQFRAAALNWFLANYYAEYLKDENAQDFFANAAFNWFIANFGENATFTHPCTLLAPELRQHVANGEFGKCLPAFVVHGVNRAKINALEAVWVQYHNELKHYEGQTPGYPMPDDRTLYFAG